MNLREAFDRFEKKLVAEHRQDAENNDVEAAIVIVEAALEKSAA
ncbi:MAG TPA: hypothetical protein VNX86_04680 [Rhizomicrobium sp.]|jgi:hypothetical protein|nr:hypothetical protein [Rhizomicrobium sp.]